MLNISLFQKLFIGFTGIVTVDMLTAGDVFDLLKLL
jgi:hypothetical protein